MWPFEGMPTWLRYISGILPATYPAQAMRAIMGRGIIPAPDPKVLSCHKPFFFVYLIFAGWGFVHYEVWRGFTVSTAWFLLFLFIAGLAFSLRK